ncbi:hypothetical protein HQ544_03340 [Candidatus Falkowbacteria bacterium]|nr:hypothetical protein [Candidatus Falkowbacteria bacterium]
MSDERKHRVVISEGDEQTVERTKAELKAMNWVALVDTLLRTHAAHLQGRDVDYAVVYNLVVNHGT